MKRFHIIVIIAFLLLLLGSVANFRAASAVNARADALRRLANGHVADLERLANYEAMAERFLAADFKPFALPLGIPAPKKSQTSTLAPIDGWQTVKWKAEWPRIKTGQAFAILSAADFPWRVAALSLVALDDEHSRLSLLLVTVRAESEQTN